MFRPSTVLSRSRRLAATLAQASHSGNSTQTTTAAAKASTRYLHQVASAASGNNSIHNSSNLHGNKSKSIDQFPTASHQQPQYRTVFVQTENTPNPESIKFVPTNTVVLEDDGTGNGYFVNKSDPMEDILKSPLCTELFKIDGVKAVYLGNTFVTVTKFAEAKWQFMRPDIFSCLMDFFESGQSALVDQPIITDTTIMDDDDEIVAMIKELIEQRIRPAVQEDGGDIRYISFDEHDGLVTVQLAGSCVGCPSSSVTLKQGVENMLMHYIPEVTSVVALEEEEEDGEGNEVEEVKTQKSYEERLAAAGIPFSN
ncbi:unnamed protein product [Cylindrotheca closterium]|uniref:Scaffold protein Nfu/NifU N-terminal domain-containing protein n=1 Tax=Cylindrotheca closterium TaxID=2856 RepID=A0AAD2CAW9_9STRA|nr:unnamed protein product [Cylindrotheca closterium]